MISCSNDDGATWTSPQALPLGGDHPRIAVGMDGKVYSVTENGHSVLLTRFSSCSSKPPLALEMGPITVEAGSVLRPASGANVECPVPGLDRCDESLSSPTVAPDPLDPKHLFVTYAQHADAPHNPRGFDFEWIVSRESSDAGNSFGHEFILNKVAARRFMPWSCSALGTVFAGWYDREAAVGVPPFSDDFTDYLLGSPVFPQTINLTGNSDPQCASGWGFGGGATRSQDDSKSCSVQPQQAGQCLNGSSGSGSPCDFNLNNCTVPGESCQTGNGLPKYGDYSGISCALNRVITAWTSAVAPADLPPGTPITQRSIFARVVPLFPPNGPATYDSLQIDIVTGNDDARGSSEIIAHLASEPSFVICLKPSNSLPPDGICPNGDGATDQTGRDNWQNGDEVSQTFFVPTPQPFPGDGFGSLTITLIQGPCSPCTSDNWDLTSIAVTAIDSTGRLGKQLLSDVIGSPEECTARLRDAPWSQSVLFSLHNPATNEHVYVGGNANGLTATCSNNGGE